MFHFFPPVKVTIEIKLPWCSRYNQIWTVDKSSMAAVVDQTPCGWVTSSHINSSSIIPGTEVSIDTRVFPCICPTSNLLVCRTTRRATTWDKVMDARGWARVRTESCAQPNTPCEFYSSHFYDSTCQRRYRMIAIDLPDPLRSPQVAVFEFPAGCVCKVYPIKKTTTSAPFTMISWSTSKSIRWRR